MGKASKQRPCPALGTSIKPSECGEGRVSRHPCPADCPHNPYSIINYESLLKFETDLDQRSVREWLASAADPGETLREYRRAMTHASAHHAHAFVMRGLFFERDGNGQTHAERFAARGFPGFGNDEKVLFRAKARARVVLLEVRRVVDGLQIEGTDLLAPDSPPLLIVDRSLASRAVRFTTLLCWAYPLPHFWRVCGTLIPMIDVGEFTPLEILRETVHHLGGPRESVAMREWIPAHFAEINDSFEATKREEHRLMVEGMDLSVGKMTYRLNGRFEECLAALDRDPEVDEGELTEADRKQGFSQARDWFDDTVFFENRRLVLGRVVLGQSSLRVEGSGRNRTKSLCERLEKCLGDRISLEKEVWEDLGIHLRRKASTEDVRLAPPVLLKTPRHVSSDTFRYSPGHFAGTREEQRALLLEEANRKFADEPLPLLGGRTPREAAADPSLRGTLLGLVKDRVRQVDESNLSTGREDDIGFLVRDLGLSEIDFPPPPPRPRPAIEKDEDVMETGEDESFEDEVGDEEFENGRDVLSPFRGRLSRAQVEKGVDNALERFPTAASALQELEDSDATLIEDLRSLSQEKLSDLEFGFLLTSLIPFWFTLVEPGALAPTLNYDAMEESVLRYTWRRGATLKRDASISVETLVQDSRQPEVVRLFSEHLLAAIERAPKADRPRAESLPLLLAMASAVINELDLAVEQEWEFGEDT